MSEEKFWLVWNPSGFAPKHRHASKMLAEAEAKRLAQYNDGEFYVLEATGKAKRNFPPVSFTELSDALPY